MPPWLTVRAPSVDSLRQMKPYLSDLGLHTVCESAMCPNIGQCFGKRTATFMILGDVCTRACRFCAVAKGKPAPLDPAEPTKVAEAVAGLGLRHAVITSVTRDDLLDGGAGAFAETIRAIHERAPGTIVEVLIPDFGGDRESLRMVVEAAPEIINHNLETVPRLYATVRPQAVYPRSLELLRRVKELNPAIPTKSGLMLGLGETRDEVLAVMDDLRGIDCDMLTLGQYLRPSQWHLEVVEFITPEAFAEYRQIAEDKGFKSVASAPLVRSSFNAAEVFEASNSGQQ